MKHPPIVLERMLGSGGAGLETQREVFALIVLGLLDSVENGVLTPSDAISILFNVANCRFVSSHMKSAEAEEVMGRGTQLADLFDSLDPETARRECAVEVAAIRTLCLAMLGNQRLVA